jgi:hypothetical protein
VTRATALSVALAVGAVGIATGSGCGGRQSPGSVTRDDAVFKIRSNVSDANLYIDGRYVGPISLLRGGIAVAPGKHRLELRHDDYFSRYLEVDLQRAERRKLEVTMAPILP